jgi:hypothetical protein
MTKLWTERDWAAERMAKVTVSQALRGISRTFNIQLNLEVLVSDHGEDWGLAAVEAACNVKTWASMK